MLGKALNGLSQMTGSTLHMEPPAFAADMAAALMSSLMVEALYGQRERRQSRPLFACRSASFRGSFCICPKWAALRNCSRRWGVGRRSTNGGGG